MKRSIEQLLQDVDVDAIARGNPLAEPGALAERVRSVARRRRIVRRATGVTLACGVVVGIAATMMTSSKPAQVSDVVAVHAPPAAPRDARAELIALRAEADREAERARQMIATERVQARVALLRRKAMAAPDPAEQARQQLERAALSMVYEADRLAARGEPAAHQVYAAAAANFPDTHWADVARERLAVERERKDGSG